MDIVFFIHPPFLSSQSMPRFANMLIDGMRNRGHNVKVWTPKPIFYNLFMPASLRKWMGYIDQYIIFPRQIKTKLKKIPANTLFVFTDQALGIWIPLVKDRPHVIHCHDFLAQRSALGEISENPTSKSGQQYQKYIRRGYLQGKNFISVSQKTKDDLHRFLNNTPALSELVYNGMNRKVQAIDPLTARMRLTDELQVDLQSGYILHVGGNQWYKNRKAVIDLYTEWRKIYGNSLPLLMIGAAPTKALLELSKLSPYVNDIYFVSGKEDCFVQMAYAGATVFIFPSLAEGFGWPIAEAMAMGCPVITTGEAPMNEVGGSVASYIDKMPLLEEDQRKWQIKSARTIEKIISQADDDRLRMINAGFQNVARFNTENALEKIERIYKHIVCQ